MNSETGVPTFKSICLTVEEVWKVFTKGNLLNFIIKVAGKIPTGSQWLFIAVCFFIQLLTRSRRRNIMIIIKHVGDELDFSRVVLRYYCESYDDCIVGSQNVF